MLGGGVIALAGAEGAEPPGPAFFNKELARLGALYVNVDVVAGIEGGEARGVAWPHSRHARGRSIRLGA